MSLGAMLTACAGRHAEREAVVTLSHDQGGGLVFLKAQGKHVISLGASDAGGALHIANFLGDTVVDVHADEYGMGYVGVFNRLGKGRTLEPPP